MNNVKKVDSYYKKFLKADQKIDEYIDEVGSELMDCGFCLSPEEFRETLQGMMDERENARIQFERVVREERVSIGPIVVTKRSNTAYDGKYLFDNLDPSIRDEVVEVKYSVKAANIKKLSASGSIPIQILADSIIDTRETVALKGVPSKIGLG